ADAGIRSPIHAHESHEPIAYSDDADDNGLAEAPAAIEDEPSEVRSEPEEDEEQQQPEETEEVISEDDEPQDEEPSMPQAPAPVPAPPPQPSPYDAYEEE